MPIPSEIRDAYDPERFRADGHRLIDALADQLARWQRARGTWSLPWQRAGRGARGVGSASPSGGELVDDLVAVARASTGARAPALHGAPGAAAAAGRRRSPSWSSALLNNGMAVAEMGPATVPIELAVIDWMCGKLGLPAGAGGVLTSGGSLGNLTALLAMRQAHAGFDVWKARRARGAAARGDRVARCALLDRAHAADHGLGRWRAIAAAVDAAAPADARRGRARARDARAIAA